MLYGRIYKAQLRRPGCEVRRTTRQASKPKKLYFFSVQLRCDITTKSFYVAFAMNVKNRLHDLKSEVRVHKTFSSGAFAWFINDMGGPMLGLADCMNLMRTSRSSGLSWVCR